MTKSICPLCLGKGTIINPKRKGDNMVCPNCQGEGFVGFPDNYPIRLPKPIYWYKRPDIMCCSNFGLFKISMVHKLNDGAVWSDLTGNN